MKAVVILYNSQISDSITLKSLAFFAPEISNLGLKEIVIWNNGSHSLSLSASCYQILATLHSLGIAINLQECLANAPLSHIYNRHTNSQDYGLVFDDDTALTAEYIEDLKAFISSETQIFIPTIYANNAIFYPYLNGQLATGHQQKLFTGEVASITSGMCLSPSAIKSLQNRYAEVFDSRFNIYGVDTTFFLRTHKSGIRSYFIGGRVNHNLSRATENHTAIAQFRYEERLCDMVLQIRRYLSFKTIKYFKIFLSRYTLKRFLANLPLGMRVFVAGKHPRSSKQYIPKAIALDPNKLEQEPSKI